MRGSWEDIMLRKTLLLAGCAAFALALGCTPKKEETPADPAATPDSASSAPDANGATAAAAAAGQGQNTGTPVDGEATLTAPATAGVGSEIEVGWTGPGNTSDYIDVVPRGHAATSGEIDYAYTREAMPVAKLRLPTTAGEYDVRYVLDLGSERKVKATAPVTVTAAAATLTAPPKADGGQDFTVAWTGPNAAGDYIDLVPAGHTETSGEITYAWARDGSPAKLTAPGKAGGYQIRYVLEGPGGRKVLATSALQVTQPAATVKAADTVNKGEKFKVEWTGPKSSGDYVDLVKRGQTAVSGELSYFYTDRDSTSELTAPAEAGEYDIRYILDAPGGRLVIAKTPVRVR
jgi:Ca-activated chloride channel family protein